MYKVAHKSRRRRSEITLSLKESLIFIFSGIPSTVFSILRIQFFKNVLKILNSENASSVGDSRLIFHAGNDGVLYFCLKLVVRLRLSVTKFTINTK